MGDYEYNLFDISKCAVEGINYRPVLVFEDNTKDSEKIWITVGCIKYISHGIRVEKSDGNTVGFSVWTSDDAIIGNLDSQMIVVADTSKLGLERGFKETASLGVPEWSDEGNPEGGIFALILSIANKVHLEQLNEILIIKWS